MQIFFGIGETEILTMWLYGKSTRIIMYKSIVPKSFEVII